MSAVISKSPIQFGIMTAQQNVDYQDLVAVWREADAIPTIEHAWLFDHLMPIAGDPYGPILDGWTTLAALASQTTRVRLGLLVSSNRFRPPAMLAKIATTVDVISNGRMNLGIGVGSRPKPPEARREFPAFGLPFHDVADAIIGLDEACTVIRRLWTETQPFDFHATTIQLTGAFSNPRPVQPHPPILIGGRADSTLRIAARHADVWNLPGGDLDDAVERSARLDRHCAELGRDPSTLQRSVYLPVSYDEPASTRDSIARFIDAGFTHIVLGLPAPFLENVTQWTASELIGAC